mmetsp:Transcript_12834/g.19484  ORF Transcript_12834/g.19484 Transcript_12834/m.19484 type:complete len:301 (+) Transcript_12834:223-1125(+)
MLRTKTYANAQKSKRQSASLSLVFFGKRSQISFLIKQSGLNASLYQLNQLLVGHVFRQIRAIIFVGNLFKLPSGTKIKHFQRVCALKHGRHIGDIFFLMLLKQLRMFGPVMRRILMMHQVIVLVQHIRRSVEQRNRAHVFIVGIVRIKKQVPRPIHHRQEGHRLQHRIRQIPKHKLCIVPAEHIAECDKRPVVCHPGHHVFDETAQVFWSVIKRENRSQVEMIQLPLDEIRKPVDERVSVSPASRHQVAFIVVEAVMVDRVSARVCARHQTVKQSNPPVEGVVEPFQFEYAQFGVTFFVA